MDAIFDDGDISNALYYDTQLRFQLREFIVYKRY